MGHVSVSDFTVSKIDFGLQISKSVLNCFWYQLLLVSTASEDQLNISLSGMREKQKVYSRLGLIRGGFSEIRTKNDGNPERSQRDWVQHTFLIQLIAFETLFN